MCSRPFETIHWHDHRPGLLTPDGVPATWEAFPAETIHQALETHQPVCWNCTIAETFRNRFPDRVVDRDPDKTAS